MRQSYTTFETAVGRCAIAWSAAGILGVQLADISELATIRRIGRRFGELREQAPEGNAERAVAMIMAFLRGEPVEADGIALDWHDMPAFGRRIHDAVRHIPRGATRTAAEIAALLGASGAALSVERAVARNPFPVIMPCHRVLSAAGYGSGASDHAGAVTRARLRAIETASATPMPSLFTVLLGPNSARA